MTRLTDRLFDQQESPENSHTFARITSPSKLIPITSLVSHEKNRELNLDKVKAYVASILVNGLLQDPVVSAKGDGTYTIISGHHRIQACRDINEMTHEYENIRCKVLDVDDIDAELALLDSNIQTNPLNPYEMMMAIGRKEEILKEKKTKGTLREIIANNLPLEPTQVGTYLKVYKRASVEVKESLKQGKITLEKASKLISIEAKSQAINTGDCADLNTGIMEYRTLLKKYYALINKVTSINTDNLPLNCNVDSMVSASLNLKIAVGSIIDNMDI